MTTVTQDTRLLAVDTPLERDVLLLGQFSGSEQISGLFRFELELFAETENAAQVVAEDLLGNGMTVSIKLPDGTPRHFHGIVSRFCQTGEDERFFSYKAEIVPWLWQLTLSSNCQIFQDKTVPEIIKEVFKDFGLTDVRDALTGTYTKLDYCVQYGESHYNFVCRLMEREGIFFFFEHEEGKHTLVLGDAPDAHPAAAQAEARFEPDGGEGEREDTIASWLLEQELHPGKYTARDFNFQMPSKSLEVSEATTIQVGENSKYEVFEFPGEYAQRFIEPEKRLGKVEGEGMTLARVRMQEEEASHKEATGRSECRGFTSGHKFTLARHQITAMNGDYVLTSIQHHVTQSPDYYSGSSQATPYQNSFNCIPYSVPYRPSRSTPKPVMRGVQTAVVVGKKGEEIWTDKYGRIKVQFPWDRKGESDQDSSCWIRVSQPWAGQNWGTIALPRIGQEVLIDFVDGDPDHPIVIGRVYNAEQMPPYALPDNQTQSGMKSRSTKGGGEANFNEIRFEDLKGKEQVYVHAEKNMSTVVENDDTQSVTANRSISVGGKHTETITKDTKISITEGTFDHDVVAKTAKYHVKGAVTETYEDTQTTTVTKTIFVDCKANILIQAADEIKLQTGSSVLVMKKNGEIKISGDKIEVTAGTEVKSGVGNQSVTCSTSKVETSGAAINSSAVGMHEITGALVKIN